MSTSSRVEAAAGSEWDDVLPNKEAQVTSRSVSSDSRNNQVKVIMQKLDDREWQVVVMRFGLLDGDARTIADISETLLLSRERVRQIENATLNEIMHSDQIKMLTGELERREQLVISMRFGFLDGTAKTLKETGDMLHLPIGGVRQIERTAITKLVFNALGVPAGHFEQLNKERRVSHASPLGEEGDIELISLRQGVVAGVLPPIPARHALKGPVKEMLDGLEWRERKIIMMRFGLSDGEEKTLKDIGDTLLLTRERVRQIEHAALNKLRGQIPVEDLRDLLS